MNNDHPSDQNPRDGSFGHAADDDRTITREEYQRRVSTPDPVAADTLTMTLFITGRDPIEMSGRVTIGRDPRADTGEVIAVDGDPLVSKSHLALDTEADGLIVTDLGSSNGSFIRSGGVEKPIPTNDWIAVPDDAEIEFGDQLLTFTIGSVSEVADDAVVGSSAPMADAPAFPVDDDATPPAGVPVTRVDDATCSNCARPLTPDARFCEGCGTPTVASAAPPSPSPSPSPSPPSPAPAPSVADLWESEPADDLIPPGAPAPVAPPPETPAASPPPPAHVPPTPDFAPDSTIAVPPSGFAPAPHADPAFASDSTVAVPSGGFQPGPAAGVPGKPAQGFSTPGQPSFVDPSASADESGSSGNGKKIGLVIGGVVVFGLAVFGVTKLLGGGDSGGSGGAVAAPFEGFEAPTEVDEQWSQAVSGADASGIVTDAGVYVYTIDDEEALVTSFGIDNGDVAWEIQLGDGQSSGSMVGQFGDIVVASTCEGFDDCELFGLDRSSGDEVWSQRSDGFALEFADMLLIAGTTDDGESVESIDPQTGDSLERRAGTDVTFHGDSFVIRDDNEVEVFTRELEPRFGPVDIPDDTFEVAFDDSHVIAAVSDELLFIDENSDVARTSSIASIGETVADIFVTPSGDLIIEVDGIVASIDPVDGDAEEQWTQTGRFRSAIDSDAGLVVIIANDDGDEIDVIDAASGDRTFSANGFDFLVGRNALIIFDEDDDGQSASTTAFGYADGDEIWNLQLEGPSVVGAGRLVELRPDGDVILYR